MVFENRPQHQLNREESIAFGNDPTINDWTAEQIVEFQLFQERLCFSISGFKKALSTVLDRPVFTHELASPEILREEWLKKKVS